MRWRRSTWRRSRALVDRLIATFTAGCSGGARAGGAEVIAIVGLPRSGTTLVEQIVSAHPDVHAGGELPFWNAPRRRLGRRRGDVSSLAADAASYLTLLRDLARGAARVTDKMPMNILWAGMIHMALPDAVIIHCTRAPADTALSIHQTYSVRDEFPTGGAALVGYIRATHRLAAHWRRVLPPSRFIDIAYEDLTRTPEPVIRALVDACGLDWSEACLRPQDNERVIRTPSKWQARQKIYIAFRAVAALRIRFGAVARFDR